MQKRIEGHKAIQWYHTLKIKNMLFFTLISLFFLIAIVINFSSIKESTITKKAKERITLATQEVVRDLLLKQRAQEQAVLDMANVASVNNSEELFESLLNFEMQKEIIGAGIWFNNGKYFYHDRDGDKEAGFTFEEQEFYLLGKYLKKGETFWSKVYRHKGRKYVTVFSPIYQKQNFVGVATLDIALDVQEKEIFLSSLKSKEKYFMLTDRVGNFILLSDNLQKYAQKKDIYALQIPVFTSLMMNRSSCEVNRSLAKTISNISPKISLNEALQITREIGHTSHTEKLIQSIKILEEDPIFEEKSVISSYYFPHTGWNMIVAIPEHIVFEDMISIYNQIIFTTIIFAILAALLGYYFISKSIVKPLMSISEQIEDNFDNTTVEITTDDKGEIALLVQSFNKRNKLLFEAHKREMVNEKLLLQQSKMAAMGEMLDAVAHQWKQPLNALSMHAEILKMDYDDNRIDAKYISKFQDDIQKQIKHMTDTLSTFRTFFRPNAKLSHFEIDAIVEDVLFLLKDEFMKYTINVELYRDEKITIYGSPNEFKHLLLNILNNAKDAFIENKIEERKIWIRIIDEKKTRVEIEDNAGGIPADVIDKVFQAHFTTKDEGKGTGIGLYMSLLIAQKHNASLSVANINDGACFSIVFH